MTKNRERSLTTIQTDSQGNQFEMRPWSCPTCGPRKTKVLGHRGGRHQRDNQGVETEIVSCTQCGLLFPQPFPVPVDPQRLYGDPGKYFVNHDLEAKVARYRELFQEIRTRVGKTQFSLLDIGSGRGDLIHAARLEGCTEAVGLEFSQAMIRFAKERFDVELLDKSAAVLAQERPGSFDAVVLNAVLEHVYDPLALMRDVATLCKPGAVLYVDVPREPHLLTVVGNTWNRVRGRSAVFNLQPTWSPFHVYGFNPRFLEILLKKTGFKVEGLRVHASPHVSSGPRLKDRIQAKVATQVNKLANVLQFSSNMYVWARREHA